MNPSLIAIKIAISGASWAAGRPNDAMTVVLIAVASLWLIPEAAAESFSATEAQSEGQATLRFSNVFAAHMVLQRGEPIELWGFGASPTASALTVHLGSATASVFWPVAADGSWRAVLPAVHDFGCNGTDLVLRRGGTAVQTLADVCIGDVYLFSGQSNIDLPEAYANQFDAAAQTKEEAFADANTDIRLRIISHPPTYASSGAWPNHPAELANVPDSPLCVGNHTPFDAAGKYRYCQTDALGWARANGTVIRGFSATAWFTGTALRKSMGTDQRVPLGLIRSSAGGTKIRMWSSADALAKCVQSSPAPTDSSTLFENMIQPLKGVNFAAVVWYQVRSMSTAFENYLSSPVYVCPNSCLWNDSHWQGESDVGAGGGHGKGQSFFGSAYYSCALPAMLSDWRLKLNRPLLPFLLVELAAYCNEHGASTFKSWCDQNTSAINTTDTNLPAMRLTQGRYTSGLPLVFVETAADLGSIHPAMGSIHPAAKQELGAR